VASFHWSVIVVDDVRFANEAEYLRAEGFLLVRILRPPVIDSRGSTRDCRVLTHDDRPSPQNSSPSTLDPRPSTSSHSSEEQDFPVDIVLENIVGLPFLFLRLDALLSPA
jgi:hypothetical protein